MAKTRRARARRSRAPERFLRPAKVEERLSHVRAFLEAVGEPVGDHVALVNAAHHHGPVGDHVALVNAAHHHGPVIWPDDPVVTTERAEDIAVLAEYRAMLE